MAYKSKDLSVLSYANGFTLFKRRDDSLGRVNLRLFAWSDEANKDIVCNLVTCIVHIEFHFK